MGEIARRASHLKYFPPARYFRVDWTGKVKFRRETKMSRFRDRVVRVCQQKNSQTSVALFCLIPVPNGQEDCAVIIQPRRGKQRYQIVSSVVDSRTQYTCCHGT